MKMKMSWSMFLKDDALGVLLACLVSKAFGMVYFLHVMNHLIFGMKLVFLAFHRIQH